MNTRTGHGVGLNGRDLRGRLFCACCFGVAHRQFSGEYGPLLSMRSSEHPSGRSPMSDTNAAKSFFHRSQTEMPRPPYLSNANALGFSQRFFIPSHRMYSGWRSPTEAQPCFVNLLTTSSRCRQPHERVFPDVRLFRGARMVFPHSHSHLHVRTPRGVRPSGATTTSRPYLWPAMSMCFAIQIPCGRAITVGRD
jgi:hypothetical protein